MDKKKLGNIAFIAALILGASSCVEKDVYQSSQEKKEFNNFDFSTIQKNIDLEVSYTNSGIETNIYFELYDEIPVSLGEHNYIKKDGITPLFAAYTADNSVYKGEVELPAYVKKVYIYTPAFFAQTLIEAEVVNGAIKAVDFSGKEATTRIGERGGKSYMLSKIGAPFQYNDVSWKSWLGSYYSNGAIQYEYSNGLLAAKASDGLYSAHTKVIDIKQKCPEKYRSYSDMYISKAATVVVTYLGSNTCWNSSMGYYYYKEGEKPASLDKANVIMLFPNTQDGKWSPDPARAAKTAGIDRLTAVELKYYPNIAKGSDAGATNVFPAGYRIGFVLAFNAWSNRVVDTNSKYRAATSQGLSLNNSGVAYNMPRTAVYRYNDWVMISFEDFKDDENFSDVVVTLKSNPVDAITDIPDAELEDQNTTSNVLKGIYTFEDLWPGKGDYDMNDVVLRYTYGKTFNSSNKILNESFTFKVFENIASNHNGLGFKLKSNGIVSSAKCYIRKAGETKYTETTLQYEATDNVYILTDNVKNNIKGEYMITVDYGTSGVYKEAEIEPFIFKNKENGKRWEVHLPKGKPTSKVDDSYFGKEDDASKPERGIYYVREGAYPFAIFLSGANENDLSPILQIENERTPIDKLFNGYKGWIESNGTANTDWYKKKN
ncbi:LruC domain-containing protein [Bacteroides heparinolyticus]|uniref:LruC domain-containing protein n=1 Tax=Prevotella heparinolytica TaxID=28113 RepID=UPI00359FAECA